MNNKDLISQKDNDYISNLSSLVEERILSNKSDIVTHDNSNKSTENDHYDMILNKINSLLNSDDYIDNLEFISVYSLYKMVKDRYSELYRVNHNKDLEKKIISIYRKRSIHNYFSARHATCRVDSMIINNKMEITFHFNNSVESYYVFKDVGDSHLYCPTYLKKLDDDIMKGCILEINDIFKTLEDYSDLIEAKNSEDERKTLRDIYNFSYQDFSGDICSQWDGNVLYSIQMDGLKEYISYRRWFGECENIEEYINNNSLELLKKIPIPVSSLDNIFKKVYEDNQNKKVYSK